MVLGSMMECGERKSCRERKWERSDYVGLLVGSMSMLPFEEPTDSTEVSYIGDILALPLCP